MQQQNAFDLLKWEKCFLTGGGSGSILLININYLKENNVAFAVTASTGIAATHLPWHDGSLAVWYWRRDYLTNKDLEKLAIRSD